MGVYTQITDELNNYQTISLQDLLQIELLNRKDTKYIFNLNQLPQLLRAFKPYYKVLKIEEHRVFNYETLYFDTPAYDLYHNHHNGKLNRYKVRYRRYLETDTCFFEIKFKSNTGRTIKTRINNVVTTIIDEEGLEFIKRNTPKLARKIDIKELDPKLLVFYKRITLASIERQERFTIDIDLNFINFESADVSEAWPTLAIAEIKQDVISLESPVFSILKQHMINPLRISKYCMGVVLTDNDNKVKYNRFKPKILKVNKVINSYDN